MPKDIKNQVIPVDRLTACIKKVNSEKDTEDCLEKQMTSLAHFFLDLNKPAPDYTKKYSQLLNTETAISENLIMPTQEASLPAEEPMPETDPKDAEQVVLCSRCGSDMVLRTATKGDNAGTSFYGCSRFPKCRNIVHLKFLL